MTRGRYAILLGLLTGFSAVMWGLVRHNPNWPLNMPIGFVLGCVAGLMIWPVVAWMLKQSNRGRGRRW